MTTKETQESWTNDETRCVHRWLTGSTSTYYFWLDEARTQRTQAADCGRVREGTWTPPQAETIRLAARMKQEHESFRPLKEPDVYTDLLDAALAAVDWKQIAAAFLGKLEPDEGPSEPEGG